MAYKQYPDELYHFGIKGMKWGVRRFQNKDGSYTKQGLSRRYGASGGSRSGGSGGKARGGSGSNAEARKAKIKKAAMIAAGVAGTAALGYGAYKLAKSGKGQAAIEALRNSKVGQGVAGAAGKARSAVGNSKMGKAVSQYKKDLGNPTSKAYARRAARNAKISGVTDKLIRGRDAVTGLPGKAKSAYSQYKKDLGNPTSKAYARRAARRAAISKAGDAVRSAPGNTLRGAKKAASGAGSSVKRAMDFSTNPSRYQAAFRSKNGSYAARAAAGAAGIAAAGYGIGKGYTAIKNRKSSSRKSSKSGGIRNRVNKSISNRKKRINAEVREAMRYAR